VGFGIERGVWVVYLAQYGIVTWYQLLLVASFSSIKELDKYLIWTQTCLSTDNVLFLKLIRHACDTVNKATSSQGK